MIIREILASKKSGEIFSVTINCPIQRAIEMMTEHNIGSLVVKENDKMIGLITDRCIVRGLTKTGCNYCATSVREVMMSNPIVGHLNDTVDDVRRTMTDNHLSHLPVEDDNGLVGIISFFDIARSAVSEADFQNRLLKSYIKNWPEA